MLSPSISMSSSTPSKKNTIACATCGQPTSYFSEPVGPFCSHRCQMVDLGRWMNEEYAIREPLRAEHFAQYEEMMDQAKLDRPEEE
jgi:uncharacterized protein